LLGKVARSAGWGVARCFGLKSDCTTVTANLHRYVAAFHTPSAATRHLPRFAEKEGSAAPPAGSMTVKEGGRTGSRKLCFDPSSETAARPPAPARPHKQGNRRSALPPQVPHKGAGARRTFARLTSPDCTGSGRDNPALSSRRGALSLGPTDI